MGCGRECCVSGVYEMAVAAQARAHAVARWEAAVVVACKGPCLVFKGPMPGGLIDAWQMPASGCAVLTFSPFCATRAQSCTTGCGPTAAVFNCVQIGNNGTTTCALPAGMTVPAANRNGFAGGIIKMVVYSKPYGYVKGATGRRLLSA